MVLLATATALLKSKFGVVDKILGYLLASLEEFGQHQDNCS